MSFRPTHNFGHLLGFVYCLISRAQILWGLEPLGSWRGYSFLCFINIEHSIVYSSMVVGNQTEIA